MLRKNTEINVHILSNHKKKLIEMFYCCVFIFEIHQLKQIKFDFFNFQRKNKCKNKWLKTLNQTKELLLQHNIGKINK